MRCLHLPSTFAALVLSACAPPPDPSWSEAARRGAQSYRLHCAACHGRDPHRDGDSGPAIARASGELLRAKVLAGTYPPGHTPLRPTREMPLLPMVAERIDDLAAYLAEVAPPGTAGGGQ